MKKKYNRLLRLALLAACMLLSAYVAEMKAQRIVFMPQYETQSQFAGYYAAKELGYYRDVGLNVRFKSNDKIRSTLQALHEGRCNMITTEAIAALVSMEKYPRVVNIFQTTQHSTLWVLARRPGVKSLRDLKGCKVATWKLGFSELPRLVDYIYQTNIKWVETTDVVGLYASGAVDAVLVKSYNEKLQIDMSSIGYKSAFSFRSRGYDISEDGVYVTYDYFIHHPMECKAFAEASRKGWNWVRANKEKALDIVMKYSAKDGGQLSRMLQRVQLDSVIENQREVKDAKPSFRLNKESYEWLSELLFRYKLINKKTDYSNFTKEK